MRIEPGCRLGPYEIVAPLGAGGMGEVYRALDTRLDRPVALKILPDTLAADPQFRDRFDREARTISQLSHPNICPLFDVGHQDGVHFLVMEYLEGETLADRLARSQVSSLNSQGSTLKAQLSRLNSQDCRSSWRSESRSRSLRRSTPRIARASSIAI